MSEVHEILRRLLTEAAIWHWYNRNKIPARDTLTKLGKSDKTPDPYTSEQVRALMERVAGTEWEMPVVLGGLYGMRRSGILGLRWQNVDLKSSWR